MAEDGSAVSMWQPSAAWRLFFTVVMYLYLGMIFAFIAALLGFGSLHRFHALLLLIGAFVVSIVVHEIGHYVAARQLGMQVLRLRLWWLEIAPLRRGWRCRIKRYAHKMPTGSVLALPAVDRPWRRAFIVFALGGVAANVLLLSILGAALAFVRSDGAAIALCLVSCICAMPLVNLLPIKAVVDTDGIVAWRWWRHPPAESDLLGMRALSRLISGTLLSALPQDEAAAFARLSEAHAVYYAVVLHQERGEWREAAALGDALDAAVPKNAALRSAYAELILYVRAEIAFSRAAADRDASFLPDSKMLRQVRWAHDCLPARCGAFRAWLQGDAGKADVMVRETLRRAALSIERASPQRERLLLETLFGRAV
ncbi:hypothetical protein SAMN02800691_1189 [Luteibacter sp. UNCMF366Tsu5.1]|nr:hypothetical protein SAMN02800691_1189 [Luteibacter sp. UNCMF366Tsu5.1]